MSGIWFLQSILCQLSYCENCGMFTSSNTPSVLCRECVLEPYKAHGLPDDPYAGWLASSTVIHLRLQLEISGRPNPLDCACFEFRYTIDDPPSCCRGAEYRERIGFGDCTEMYFNAIISIVCCRHCTRLVVLMNNHAWKRRGRILRLCLTMVAPSIYCIVRSSRLD